MVLLLACSNGVSIQPISLADGTYTVVVPPDWSGDRIPVLLHLHGHHGTVDRSLQALDLDQAAAMQTLILYPQGQANTWTVMGEMLGGSGRDDLDFLRRVMDDAAERWPIDRDRVYISGFSLGGSMTQTVVCQGLPGWTFAAMAPASGGWWDPLPTDCAHEPIPICRIHGTEDELWTWEGRLVTEEEGGPYQQIGVEEDVAWWREYNGCDNDAPEPPVTSGDLNCDYWTACDAEVGLCSYEGGHTPVHEWLLRELEWMKRFSQ